jgi:hypothetical protein
MPDRVVQDFPLFPLGLVALPYEYVPLHIFEERYRTMIAEVLERESEFGIVWVGEEGVRQTGCAMEVTRVLERMEDGRLNILTRGTRPFRVVEEQHDLPYPAATVEFLRTRTRSPTSRRGRRPRGLPVPGRAGHGQRARSRRARAAQRVRDGRHRRLRPGGQAGPARPALGERPLRLVARLFRAATKRLEFIERAQVRARSNGKVRFG